MLSRAAESEARRITRRIEGWNNINDDDVRSTIVAIIAEALLAVQDETAREAMKVGYDAVHLESGDCGCDGCEDGWCQSAVDAIAEGRNQFREAIRARFGLEGK